MRDRRSPEARPEARKSPRRQAEAFRRDRRAVCAYAKSVGFRGTGYGINTTRCELALTDALLDQLVQPEEAQR